MGFVGSVLFGFIGTGAIFLIANGLSNGISIIMGPDVEKRKQEINPQSQEIRNQVSFDEDELQGWNK